MFGGREYIIFVDVIFAFLFFSANQEVLNKVEAQYETLPGWDTDISNARTFNELPVNAQNYVRFIEMELGVPGK